MASEISITLSFAVTKNTLRLNVPQEVTRHTLAGEDYSAGTQIIGLIAEQIAVSPDLASAGQAYFRNVSTAEGPNIQIGLLVGSTFYPFAELAPGERALVPLATTTLYALAVGSGTARLQHLVLER